MLRKKLINVYKLALRAEIINAKHTNKLALTRFERENGYKYSEAFELVGLYLDDICKEIKKIIRSQEN